MPPETKTIDVRNDHWLQEESLEANLVKGEHVTVVLPLESGYRVFPGIPVLVTAGQRDEETIRALLEDAERLRNSPSQIDEMAASLSYTPNPSLAGFLYAYVMYGKKPKPYPTEHVFAVSMPLLPHLRALTRRIGRVSSCPAVTPLCQRPAGRRWFSGLSS